MTASSHPGLPAPDRVKRIVALMIGEIGDLLVSFPTLEALKGHYPEARLTLIARPALRELVSTLPAVDEFLAFARAGKPAQAWFLVRLALRRWDLWVDLHTPTYNTWCDNSHVFRRNQLLMRFAATPMRLGFAVPPMHRRLTHAVPAPDDAVLQSENIVDTTLRLVDAPGERRWRKSLRIPDAIDAAMRARLDITHASPPLIGLFFGAKQPAKFWPEANIREFLALALARHPDHRFVMLGGPFEAELAASVMADMATTPEPRLRNLTNQCSLLETAATIRLCAAMVTTDSGPMHLADAVGTPMVTLFSAFSYLPIWLPLTPRKQVLHHVTECSPCFSAVCHHDNACMRGIAPIAVLDALDRELARREPNHDQQ